MLDFSRYFLPGHQAFLEYANFETVSPTPGAHKMACKDTIVARLSEPAGVKFTFNRSVSFEPEGLFCLSVTFSCFLRFREETRGELDWHTIDIAGEFRSGGGVILHELSSRASLLISEITSAAGQMPLITSAGTSQKRDPNQ